MCSFSDYIKRHYAFRKSTWMHWFSQPILHTIRQFLNWQDRMGKYRCERNFQTSQNKCSNVDHRSFNTISKFYSICRKIVQKMKIYNYVSIIQKYLILPRTQNQGISRAPSYNMSSYLLFQRNSSCILYQIQPEIYSYW